MKTLLASAALALTFVATAASAQAPAGPNIGQISGLLTGEGVAVGAVEERATPSPYFTATSDDLRWVLQFYRCRNEVCGDLQFGASFTNPQITQEMVNRWNGEKRFVKAFYEAGNADHADPMAVIQMDVVLSPDADADQLGEWVSLWRQLSQEFALHIGYFKPENAPAD